MTPRASRVGAASVALAAVLEASPAKAGDPYLDYDTVTTPHFRVHYHKGLEELAQRTGSLAEVIRKRLMAPLGQPGGRTSDAPGSDLTHILLVDVTDSANGSATALPYNTIRLYVTAPDDLSVLGDYDDWMTSLVTHEQTHVFHIDNVTGAAAVVNTILGKTYAPNQVQPHWILEGLAVAMESRLTSGGRLRSSLFDMYLRADVLEHNLAGLDEMSHSVRRWPAGDIWYLYGGRFIGWILDTYGPDTYSAVATDYGNNLIAWGFNRSIRRATGRTYPELYRGWVKSLEETYAAQVAAVRARGLREGTRLTRAGRTAANPRFIPPCGRAGRRPELLYFRDDGETPPGFYRVPLDERGRAIEGDIELVARSNSSIGTASYDPSCGFVYDSVAPDGRRHFFNDLMYQPPGTTSKTGRRGSHERWTQSARARSPDVSPSGEHVTFVTNHAGTVTLRIADIRPEGGLSHVRALVPSSREEQAFSPRFSPDGRSVAYSVWTKGGYRDVRVANVKSGHYYEVTHDRALDAHPAWTPDGKYLLFTSDRTGISNVYAYEVSSGTLHQVTNVLTGAYMPEASPDGRTLVYVGYGAGGFDLFSMPFDPERFLAALPPSDDRPDAPPDAPPERWPVTRYSPWATLRPYRYALDSNPGPFGQEYSVSVGGSDITGNHGFSAGLTYHSDIDAFTGSVGYSYSRLPFGLGMSAFRDLAPRAPVVVDAQKYAVREEILGATTGVTYSVPGEFDSQFVSLSYTASAHDVSYPLGRVLEPYAPITGRPRDFFLGSVRVGWSYNNVFRSVYSVSGERGFALSVTGDFAGRATGGEQSLAAFDARAVGYLLAPWARHHAFALSLSGGAAGGTYARGGYFYQSLLDVFDFVRNRFRQTAFVIRGYPPAAFVGRQYNLANFEYRFPIAWIDRGVSTLPVFLHNLSGALFADYGGAYDELDLKDPFGQYHLGLGAELRTSFALGYFLESSVKLGWAKGFDHYAVPGSQVYFVAAASF